MAAGIVVRTIAPLLKGKLEDPAVLVLDEKGNNVISLLSGHWGGGNETCERLAQFLGSRAVITTATDVNGKPAVDVLARKLGCGLTDLKQVRYVNRLLAEGKKVFVYTQWPRFVQGEGFKVYSFEELPSDSKRIGDNCIIITNKGEFVQGSSLVLRPKNLIIGIGCRRGIEEEKIISSIKTVFTENNLSLQSIKLIASIDLKAHEKGLISAAKRFGVPFKTVPGEEIKKLEDCFTTSQFVKKITGVGAVCEPVAMVMSNGGKILVPKRKMDGVTVAVAEEKYTL